LCGVASAAGIDTDLDDGAILSSTQEQKKEPKKPKEPKDVDVWTKAGVLIGAAALIVAYLGVAGTVKWWPFERSSNSSSTTLSASTLPGSTHSTAATLPSPSSSSSQSPSQSPTVSPAPAPTEPDQALVSELDSQYFNTAGCRGVSDQQSGIPALAAVNCPAHLENGNSPINSPLIIQFASGSALSEWFKANTSLFPQTSGCNRNGYVGMWHNGSGTQGQLGCDEIDNGTVYRMVWTLTSHNIGVIADGSSDNSLWAWWTAAGAVTCTCSG
jgi:hypothetical protein